LRISLKRGYGVEWDRLRLTILARDNYLCQCDQCKGGAPDGRVTLANEVNHIMPKAQAKRLGWTQKQIDHPSNLQSVNEDCHKRITVQQQGKTLRAKVRVGLDGWPTAELK
jgi:5-methylcytosine-specific restriction enzyme A